MQVLECQGNVLAIATLGQELVYCSEQGSFLASTFLGNKSYLDCDMALIGE